MRVAFAVTLVLAIVALAFLGWSIVQHQDARDDLDAARAHLVARQASTSKDTRALQRAQQALAPVHAQLGALDTGLGDLASLDEQDLEAVRYALDAGLAGRSGDYNAAVDRRTALDAQHDALVEQLRQDANAVISALDRLP